MLDDVHIALIPTHAVRDELRTIQATEPALSSLALPIAGPVAAQDLEEIRNAAGARLYQMVRIPVPECSGRLFVGPSPGHGPDSELRLDAIRDWGVDRVVCLVPGMDLAALLGSPTYEQDARDRWGDRFSVLAVVDYEAPGDDAGFEALVDETFAALAAGETILAHCALGCGRAGLFASCVLVAQGVDPIDAMRTFREIRRCGPESGDQLAYVVRYARRVAARADTE